MNQEEETNQVGTVKPPLENHLLTPKPVLIRPELKSNKPRKAAEAPISIIEAMEDPQLFQSWFTPKEDWSAWTTLLKAAFGVPFSTDEEWKLYTECTNRTTVPNERVRELALVCGRRAGKSISSALIAIYLSTMIDWSSYLKPGERGTIMIIAADRKQARVIFRYIEAFLTKCDLLRPLIDRPTMELFELSNGINIEIMTASFKGVRGYTLVAALCDEIAFWSSEDSSNPDTEILAALKPAMATIPGAMTILLSSPYAQRGALYDTYKRYFGKERDDMLVWQAPTWVMHPSIDMDFISGEYEKDAAKAEAEYGAKFRADVQIFISEKVVDSCTEFGVFERPYRSDQFYSAFVDPSGGSRDSFTLAISHMEDGKRVLDLIREVIPPFSPEAVVAEFTREIRRYGMSFVTGDRYAGEWVSEAFTKQGIEYKLSEMSRSELYLELLSMLNSQTCLLLEHDQLKLQLLGLERRTSRAGKDTVDHVPGGKDDISNSVAGALAILSGSAPVDFW